MQPIFTDGVSWSVSLSVTVMSHAKMAELIEMPFWIWTWVGTRNHVLDEGVDSPTGRSIFKGDEGAVHCKL